MRHLITKDTKKHFILHDRRNGTVISVHLKRMTNYVMSLARTYNPNIRIDKYNLKIKTMEDKKSMTLTSVKVKSNLFENFKVECVRRKFSFQKLSDRAIHLYLTDDDFRKKIHNHNNLEINE
tara:strand:+ start:55 stop:420 length:366 start_codon:yes stop_codon:yes gene_type:complete